MNTTSLETTNRKENSNQQHSFDYLSAFSVPTDLLLVCLPRSDGKPTIATRPVNATKIREPLRLEDLEDDIKRLVTSAAFKYTDQSCVFLHTDELEAECRATLANVIRKGYLSKPRGEFFRALKASFLNRMRSLVQRYRFTQKRTGRKPPPKNRMFQHFESCKPNEVSLDDPNAHIQVSEPIHETEQAASELREDILLRCNPVQKAVLHELEQHSISALNAAWIEAHRGKIFDPAKVKIHVSEQSMANAVGLDLPAFKKAVLHLQEVTLKAQEMKPEEQHYDAVLATLANIFSLQIPRSTPPLVVKRMLTLAARDNWQKVTAEVADMLEQAGARPPKFNSNTLSCFSVLYEDNDPVCAACGLRESCRVQAMNVGLGEVTLSPKLLGTKLARTPFSLPRPTRHAQPPTASKRDNDIAEYLYEVFRPVTHLDELYFQPKEAKDKEKLIFCIGQASIPLRLRFCNPSPEMREKLTYQNKGYYAPDDMDAEEVIELIEEHAERAVMAIK